MRSLSSRPLGDWALHLGAAQVLNYERRRGVRDCGAGFPIEPAASRMIERLGAESTATPVASAAQSFKRSRNNAHTQPADEWSEPWAQASRFSGRGGGANPIACARTRTSTHAHAHTKLVFTKRTCLMRPRRWRRPRLRCAAELAFVFNLEPRATGLLVRAFEPTAPVMHCYRSKLA